MIYDLAAMVRRSTRTKRKRIAIPQVEPSSALSTPYSNALVEIADAWQAAVNSLVLPAYDRALQSRRRTLGLADAADDLGEELATAEAQLDALVLTITPKMRKFAVAVEQWHRGQWIQKVKAATRVDVAGIVGATGASETIAAFYQRNLGLISSIDDETMRRVGNTIWSGYEQLTPRDEIAREITEQIGMSRDRARRIAVDQTTKLSAALDQQRQREAGIMAYIWRHSRKRHPRVEHVVRNGLLFSWDKPPYDGPPGTLPFCGCKAEASLELTAAGETQSGEVAA